MGSIWRGNWILRIVALLSFFLACGVVGFETGWLAGWSGPDASVLAAVLPVILGAFISSVGILAARAMSQDVKKKSEMLLWPMLLLSTAAIVFTAMLQSGVGLASGGLEGENLEIREEALALETAQRKAEAHAAQEQLGLVYAYISSCTEVWSTINRVRHSARLEPLTISQVCVALRSAVSGEPSDVLVEKVVDSLLTPKALEMHQKYLQDCTTLQIAKGLDPRKDPPRIEDDCPVLAKG